MPDIDAWGEDCFFLFNEEDEDDLDDELNPGLWCENEKDDALASDVRHAERALVI